MVVNSCQTFRGNPYREDFEERNDGPTHRHTFYSLIYTHQYHESLEGYYILLVAL